MIYPHLVRKTTSPDSIPPESGIHWINTDTNEEYFSVGTNSTNDWIKRAYQKKQIEIAITQQMVDNKKVILPSTSPDNSSVTLTFYAGIQQNNGTDFEVIGNELKWDGLGLDGFIESGDLIIIQY